MEISIDIPNVSCARCQGIEAIDPTSLIRAASPEQAARGLVGHDAHGRVWLVRTETPEGWKAWPLGGPGALLCPKCSADWDLLATNFKFTMTPVPLPQEPHRTLSPAPLVSVSPTAIMSSPQMIRPNVQQAVATSPAPRITVQPLVAPPTNVSAPIPQAAESATSRSSPNMPTQRPDTINRR